MIDLDDIKKRIQKYGGGDIKALVEEVERLRAQNAELELGVTTMRARMAKAYEQRNDERAAVVAYLRALADAAGTRDLYWQGVASGNGYAAQMIERGEHRREREPLEDDSIEYRDIGKED